MLTFLRPSKPKSEPREMRGTICEYMFGTDAFGDDRMFAKNRHGVWYELTKQGWAQLPELPDDEPLGRLAE